MNRRDALGTLSVGGASLLASSQSLANALRPALHPGYAQAMAGTAPVKIRDIKTILTAPNRIRLVIVKVETTEPGLVGWGCATFTQRALVVQTALEQLPQAVPHRPQRRRDRGHLAVELRQLVLAERSGAVQRDERRRHRALGHQGQARQHAGLPAARRQGAARRGLLLPRQRRELHGGRGQRAAGDGAGLPARARPGCRRRAMPATAPAAPRRPAAPAERGDRSDQPESDLGAGPVRPHRAEAVRAPAHEARRRRRAAARRARARLAEPGGQPVQGARAVSPVLPRGSAPARGERPLPAAPPADAASRSRWASCSTRSTSTCRSSRTG